MSAAKVEQLNPVLENSKGSIRVTKLLRITAANVPRVGKPLETRQSVSRPHGGVILTVNQLQ
ncbi:unannotated protein [freshwater metagenome]|uniref:Unannotated protein n=1 Tax=freshwater metagenome TaxID=449393 RepID=A0A6J6FCB6_9ZZZZ